MTQTNKHTNRLITSSSPYLLQHAHNPVDWWEWCEEAFAKAVKDDKLVLVSIGYSACHWCHVMEHECFEKEDTAAIMNEHFVCIKVDREERPDIDQIYMEAVQMLTGSGGWPLNCFLLPDKRPLHGGTYFPKKQWEQVLQSLALFYAEKKEEANTYAANLTEGIVRINLIGNPTANFPVKETIQKHLLEWSKSFDTIHGGFTWSPKFAMPVNLELFLQYGVLSSDETFSDFVHTTLVKMAEGGIFDQMGGGFARYSTDAFWKVPHFEKMLYDNAQLLSLYANAYRHNQNPLYKIVIEKTISFLESEMNHDSGMYYSALDADSEGVEGKFYIWEKEELEQLLGADEPIYSLYYSVEQEGNWEHHQSILHKTKSDEELEKLIGKPIAEIESIVEKCNAVLLPIRNKRIKPGTDDKIIATWNGLLLRGFAESYLATGNSTYLDQAKACADAMFSQLWKDKTLYRIYKDGKVSIPGFAEDYAAFIEGLIAVYEASGEEKYVGFANEIMERAIKLFYDEEVGLFRFASSETENMIATKFDVSDDVIPSSNGIFVKGLIKLGYLLGKVTYHEMADRMLLTALPKIEKYPTMHGNWFQALLWKSYGFYQLVETGTKIPFTVKPYFANTMYCTLKSQSGIPLLKEKEISDSIKYYLCKDKVCSLPLGTLEDVTRMIG